MRETSRSVSRTVAAPAVLLYGAVADVEKMSDWSPEVQKVRWAGADRGVGARFGGRNRNGRLVWSTVSTVTTAEPGVRFAWRTKFLGLPTATWAYDFAANDDGTTTVTESWSDLRSRLRGKLLDVGVPDRPAHAVDQMEKTLAALDARFSAA